MHTTNYLTKLAFLALLALLSLLLLQCSPKVMLTSTDTNVQINKNLELRAIAKGFKAKGGPVGIEWFQDGIKVNSGPTYLFTTPEEGNYKMRLAANQGAKSAEQEFEVRSSLFDPKLVNLVYGIENFPILPEKEASLISVESEEKSEVTVNGDGSEKRTVWKEVKETYSASKNPDEFVMYDPNASVLWPGALVQGKSVASGVPDIIPIDTKHRLPGKLTLSILSGNEGSVTNKFSRETELTKSATTQAMNDILAGYSGATPAQYSYSKSVVNSSTQLDFSLDAGYSGPVNKIDGKLGVNWNEKKQRMVVKLYQKFFTITYDDPQGIRGVFKPTISFDDMRPYAAAGNPACYISSVTYGRMFVLLYETEDSELDISAALDYHYDGIVAKGYVEADFKSAFANGKITCKTFQIGGNAADGLAVSLDPLNTEKMRKLIAGGANFGANNPGEIISYRVNYLKDASLVRMNSAMEYTVTQREPISSDEFVAVPAITNMNKVRAEAELRRIGLRFEVNGTIDNCNMTPDEVISQKIPPGEMVKVDTKIGVTLVKDRPTVNAATIAGGGDLHRLSPEGTYSEGAWAFTNTSVAFSMAADKCATGYVIINHNLKGEKKYTIKAGEIVNINEFFGAGPIRVKFVCSDKNAALRLRIW